MSASITTDQVWREVEKQIFAVLGVVSSRGEPRTVGIVYVVRDRKLYITSSRSAWKVRHVETNPHVSLTVTISKRIPFLPWIPIPAATISFRGEASVHGVDSVDRELLRALLRGLAEDPQMASDLCIIEVRPRGDFVTYGVGVSMLDMRHPERARGRVPV